MNDEEITIIKLNKDLRALVESMTVDEARFLVDSYHITQEQRMRLAAQIRSAKEEPHDVLEWSMKNSATLETQIKTALRYFAESRHMGRWAMEVRGIGPVIASGLIAHIDITKAPTVGHIWAFAGLDPTRKWEKGKKRPWNTPLKTLCCMHIGECFVRTGNHPDSVYGKVYQQRKVLEQQRNDEGLFKEQAAAGAERVGKKTEAHKFYAKGKLPPGHIHARARRYAVKLFLSHWHAEAYRDHFKVEPPLPYPIAILGHAHVI